MRVLIGLSLGFAALAALFMGFAVRSYRRRRYVGTAGRTTVAALFASISALAATLSASTQGYRALTAEEVAMTITTVPLPPAAWLLISGLLGFAAVRRRS